MKKINKLTTKIINEVILNYLCVKNKIIKINCCKCKKENVKSFNHIFLCCSCEIKEIKELTKEQQQKWLKEHNAKYELEGEK